MEAISAGGVGGNTTEEQGQFLARGFYNSKNHWSYLGDPQYPYIAVGVEYDGPDNVYCCVMVSATNHNFPTKLSSFSPDSAQNLKEFSAQSKTFEIYRKRPENQWFSGLIWWR